MSPEEDEVAVGASPSLPPRLALAQAAGALGGVGPDEASRRLGELDQPKGLAVSARRHVWGDGPHGGDWHDVMSLGSGWVAALIGDVPGRGVPVAETMVALRRATRAGALLCGERPAEVLTQLDELVQAMTLGEMTTLLYLALHVPTGQAWYSNAGHCPPLVLTRSGTASYCEGGRSVPLGAVPGIDRPEARLSLSPGATVFLFTDGLVEGRRQSLPEGLAQLRRAVANGPADLETLCDHVLNASASGMPVDDDRSLLALRRLP